MILTNPIELQQFNARGGVVQASVAIVDDDLQIAQALGHWVELQDLQALHFSCAESLLQTLTHDTAHQNVSATRTDLHPSGLVAAILDLNLPGLSGVALAHLLRSLDARLPLVVVTALSEAERRHYGELPAGVHCLQKPFDLDALESALFFPLLMA